MHNNNVELSAEQFEAVSGGLITVFTPIGRPEAPIARLPIFPIDPIGPTPAPELPVL